MFSTANVEKKERKMGYYITPGVNDVTVVKITGNTPQDESKSPYIELTLKQKGVDDQFSTSFRMYLSEKTREKTLEKVDNMGTCMVKQEVLNSATGNNAEEYGDSLNNILTGKSVRMQFNSEEYINSKGETKTKPAIPGSSYFCEAIEQGAQYPVVPENSTKLRYSPNNPMQNKKVTSGNSTNGSSPVLEEKSEVDPF